MAGYAFDRLGQARDRFRSDTAEHQLTVVRDDGLYRHLRFSRPDSWFYGFDVVTWPGYLAFVGDMGDLLFSREQDMVAFFEKMEGQPDPRYLAEKLKGPGGTNRVLRYSPDLLRDCLREWVCEVTEDGGRHDLWVAVKEQILDCEEAASVDAALFLVRDFRHGDLYIEGWEEWDLWVYDEHFLWACWAILRVVSEYRAATASTAVAA
jgi:hypothetical protein